MNGNFGSILSEGNSSQMEEAPMEVQMDDTQMDEALRNLFNDVYIYIDQILIQADNFGATTQEQAEIENNMRNYYSLFDLVNIIKKTFQYLIKIIRNRMDIYPYYVQNYQNNYLKLEEDLQTREAIERRYKGQQIYLKLNIDKHQDKIHEQQLENNSLLEQIKNLNQQYIDIQKEKNSLQEQVQKLEVKLNVISNHNRIVTCKNKSFNFQKNKIKPKIQKENYDFSNVLEDHIKTIVNNKNNKSFNYSKQMFLERSPHKSSFQCTEHQKPWYNVQQQLYKQLKKDIGQRKKQNKFKQKKPEIALQNYATTSIQYPLHNSIYQSQSISSRKQLVPKKLRSKSQISQYKNHKKQSIKKRSKIHNSIDSFQKSFSANSNYKQRFK